MKKIVVWLLNLYQTYLSPETGKTALLFPQKICRFYPRCSEYTKMAIVRYGIIKGLFLGAKRIFRCHPWHKGGIDLP